MLMTWSWLSRYLDLSKISPQQLAQDLTARGVEIASLEISGKEATFDFEITPNRPDWLSAIGICREIASIYSLKFKAPSAHLKEGKGAAREMATLKVEGGTLCHLYSGRVILDVKVAASPLWLKESLEAIGLRSINNIVDITNFVLFEMGQPLHAFDLEKIAQEKGKRTVIVRGAHSGEEIVALDGKTYSLEKGEIVIGDAFGHPLALGGIIGGLSSQVTSLTRHLFLESAVFNAVSVRKTAKRLGLQTDSSYRFERGVDPQGIVEAQDRALAMIAEMAGGKILSGRLLSSERKFSPLKVSVSSQEINRLLGTDLKASAICAQLRKIGFGASPSGREGVLQVEAPSWRLDIEGGADIAEEVARVIGYDSIVPRIPSGPIRRIDQPLLTRKRRLVRSLRERLSGLGIDETCQLSFASLREISPFLKEGEAAPRIQNPIGEDLGFLKPSLISGLLAVVALNLRRNIKNQKLYEVRRVFHASQTKEMKQPHEELQLAILLTGTHGEPHWKEKGGEVDCYDLKGVAEVLTLAAGVDGLFEAAASPLYFHPSIYAELKVGGQKIGELGEIHPDLLREWGIDQRLYCATFNIDLLAEESCGFCTVEPLSPFPPVYRDLALIVSNKTPAAEVERAIHGSGGRWLSEVKLFDLYRGNPIPPDQKSLAYALTFLSHEETLSEESVDRELKKIIDHVASTLGATLRS